MTLVSSLVTVVMNFDQSVPVPMRTMFATLNVVLVNIMACRVFRRTKSGLLRETEISSARLAASQSRIRPAVISVDNRIKTADNPYRVDMEQGGQPTKSVFVATNDTDPKTMVNTDERSDIDAESNAGQGDEHWAK